MRKILCIAHRGASAYRPENTIKAFEKAIKQHADCIEIDVQKTADNQLVVYHDTSFQNKELLKDQNLAAVKQEGKSRGIDVPTLDEVLDKLNNRIILNIEIKSPGLVDLLVKKLKAYDPKKIICSSFIHSVLSEFEAKAPGIARAPVIGCQMLDPLRLLKNTNSEILVQNHEFVDKNYVELLHKKNKRIFVYTVNKVAALNQMIGYNVDGIMTDYPDVLVGLLNKQTMDNNRPEALAC
ncbi:MAG: glycerophosphodiester phosphodiesterase [Candidatus Omnitrophica bacterium]|nr:glycerophosphodiester phosphodiesterase [Candidatus Omnitrophota bacterium]